MSSWLQVVTSVADSIEDFSGTQGGDGWSFGYTTVFGSYDLLDFTLFSPVEQRRRRRMGVEHSIGPVVTITRLAAGTLSLSMVPETHLLDCYP